jgi:hypothetical protein
MHVLVASLRLHSFPPVSCVTVPLYCLTVTEGAAGLKTCRLLLLSGILARGVPCGRSVHVVCYIVLSVTVIVEWLVWFCTRHTGPLFPLAAVQVAGQ